MNDLHKLDKHQLIRLLRESQEVLAADGRDDKRLLHDLHVHQIELEMQNRELREAQQMLEAGRDRYADLYDFAPVGYLTLDSLGVAHEANLTAAALLGVNRAELIGHPLGPRLASGAGKALLNHLRQALRQEGASVVELSLERSPNGPRTLRLESKADPDQTHCRTVLHDITEQRRADQRRRVAEKAFDSAQEAIVVTSPDERIEWVNPAFERITGFSPGEVVGHTPSLLRSGQHDADFYRQIWADIDSMGYWQGEIWNRRKDGEIYPAWMVISAIRDEAGNIEHYLRMFSDITSQQQIRERLHRLAYYDGLTGLPNRWLFADRLDRTLAVARRDRDKVALLFFDLDHFKYINDSLGHRVGDELLKEVAARLHASVREGDTVARLGGDEFAVILPRLQSAMGALEVANKLQGVMSEALRVGELDLLVSPSIGIAFYPDDGQDSESLLQNADAAMYRAKQEGRNCSRTYTATMSDGIRRRLTLEQELRAAIRDQTLALAYQPQVDAVDGRLLGMEALARWPRGGREPVGPDEFIPLAESSGLILPLGHWVLQTACAQAQAWRKQGLETGRMAVNLSSHQLSRQNLGRLVAETLAATGLAPEALELEITESTLMEGHAHVGANLDALHDMGISISLDDFGTGYSSLAYLKRLLLHRLKIDRSFIQDIPNDDDDMEITASIISMAQHLRLEVMAEGVETEMQRDFLLQRGCRMMQGYLFSMPLAAPEAEALLRHPPDAWKLAAGG